MEFSRCLAFAFLVAAVLPARMISQQISATQPTAVPRLVNYSGKATDDLQKPITGVAGITFSIYKDQYAGAALWIETQSVTTDKAGNFTIRNVPPGTYVLKTWHAKARPTSMNITVAEGGIRNLEIELRK